MADFGGLAPRPTGTITGAIGSGDASATPYAVTVTVDDGQGGTATQTFNWVVNPPPMALQGATVNATEGTEATGVVVATLADPFAQESAFTVTINWGDGTTNDPGWVGDANGVLTVNGTHTYAHPGTYTVQATVTDPYGSRGVVSSTATVAAAPLTAVGGLTAEAVAGVSANQLLATFTDANPNDVIGNYTATINWGDGSATTTGTVSSLKGAYGVSGSHTYSAVGTYTATDTDNTTATVTSTVAVGNLFVGRTSNLTVASFTSSDPSAQAADFTASINWGDGTPADNTAQVAGSSGTFQATGTHIFTADGTYTVQATVTDRAGRSITTSHSVTVVRSALTGYGSDLLATPGTTLSNAVLAHFFDPNLNAAGAYTATVYWGDGAAADATAQVTGSNGVFQVLGSHLYAASAPLFDLIRVDILEPGKKFLQVAADAIVDTIRQAFPLALFSVTYEGGNTLYDDKGPDANNKPKALGGAKEPHWSTEQGFLEHLPYSYVRDTKLKVKAVFRVVNPLYNLPNVSIQATAYREAGDVFNTQYAPLGIQLSTAAPAAVQDGKATVELTASAAFADKVDDIGLVIRWAASGNGTVWYPAGSSDNQIYVTWRQPTNKDELLQTFVAYGCSALATAQVKDAQTDPKQLLEAIWWNFSSRKALRAADAEYLKYYGSWDFPSPTQTAAELVWTKDGQCTSWSDLLVQSLRAQGLTTDPMFKDGKVKITAAVPTAAALRRAGGLPRQRAGGFLVKPWTLPPGKGPFTNYLGPPMKKKINGVEIDASLIGVFSQDANGVWRYDWDVRPAPDATYDTGKGAGQNNDNPTAMFTNHVFVKIGNTYYDPSYGVTYVDENDFVKQAIAGFYVMKPNGNGPARVMTIVPPDATARDPEVEFSFPFGAAK